MRTASDKRWAATGHVLMVLLSVCAVLPFALLIIASFTEEGAAIRNGYTFFPEAFSLEAYKYIFTQWSVIGRSYLVTIFVTVTGTVTGIAIAAMVAYTLSHRDLPGRALLTFLLTFTMLFNGGLTSTYIIYTQVFHIKNTIFGLLLPNNLMNAYFVFMFRNYFENHIPHALLEAAHIDGATEVKTFFKIVIPLSLPMMATIGMTLALVYWNDWTNGLYYLSRTSNLQTIQTILNNMNENVKFLQNNDLGGIVFDGDIPTTTVRMAIAVVGIVPILCLYPIFQKWFVKGVAVGAVKE